MTDEVGFGNGPKLSGEFQDLKKVLETAVENEGEGVLTEYEEGFAKSCLAGLNRLGDKWDYSPSRKDVVERIEKKLDREGLL